MILSRRAVLGLLAASAGILPSPVIQGNLQQADPRTGALVAGPRREADITAWRGDVDTLARHGHDLLRVALPAWLLAPAPGEWSDRWTGIYRDALAYARDRGLAINLVVPGVPDWAQRYQYQRYVKSCEGFWSQLSRSFGDQVSVWQVYNEADVTHYRFFTPVDLSPAYLGELDHLLRRARGILGPLTTTNLSGWPMDDERERVWTQILDVLAPSIDLVSLDVYPADNLTEIDRLPARLERIRLRYDKQVFVAEVGLQTVPGDWDEDDQRHYLASTVRQLHTSRLWGLCLYQLRDEPSPAGFGVQRDDGTPKLGFDDIMRALSGA